MARIELRNTTIRLKDGFGGTAEVADNSISGGNSTLEIGSVSLVDALTRVPVGARFEIDGVDQVYTVQDQKANQQYELALTGALTGGNFDAVVHGQAVNNIAYNEDAEGIEDAIEAVIGVGNVQVTGVNPFLIEFIGDYANQPVTMTVDGSDLTGDPIDEEQSIAQHVEADAGTYTLTFNLAGLDPFTTAALDYDEEPADIEDAIHTAAVAASVPGWSDGDIAVTGSSGGLSAGAITLEFSGSSVAGQNHGQTTINGTLLEFDGGGPGSGTAGAATTVDNGAVVDATVTVVHPGGTTWELSFTPPLNAMDLPADEDEITFLPQQIEIKIGEGDLSYTESDEYTYDLDRGQLDTVRKGDDQPMEVSLNFVYEHITTGTNESIAPMDAIKRRGAASEWVSASEDPCEPYCVDIEVVHEPPCGSSQREITVFPDFRSESREVAFRDATIAVSGRCNAVEPIVTREAA